MTVTINGTSGLTFNDSSTLPSATFSPVFPVTASVGASAMTVTLNPCALAFRSTTLGSGSTSTISVTSAISVVIPSTATLGTVNAVQSTIMLLAINNAGTVELAVVNLSGGTNLDETTLISTSAIAPGVNQTNTYYSTTSRTSVAFRVVGAVISTQATAGTWATAPSTIQGTGGQAFTSLQSLGFGQTWQNLTGSRALATTYYNTTNRPILVNVTSSPSAGSSVQTFTVNGIEVSRFEQTTSIGLKATTSAIVPPGGTYSASMTNFTLSNWTELR